jgi:hypothetical protein
VDDYVSVPNSANLQITNEITIEAWIYANSLTHPNGNYYPTPVSKNDNPRIFVDGAGYVVFRLSGPTGGDLQIGPGIIIPGRWYHVVGTYKNGERAIYVDGVKKISRADTGTITANSYPYYIGDAWGTLDRVWNGLIDDVRIYNYARTPEQILQDYNAGLSAHFK